MAKFHGSIGYVQTQETAPGVHSEVVTEVNYTGEILRNNQRWDINEHLNDDLVISNEFSIIADAYAYENLQYIRFIRWNGIPWKVSRIEIKRPRLVLTCGGVYNG